MSFIRNSYQEGERLTEFRELFEQILEPKKGCCGSAPTLSPSQREVGAARN